MSRFISFIFAGSVAVAFTLCAPAGAAAAAPPQNLEHIKKLIDQLRAQQQEPSYIERSRAALREESRNETWAARKEGELRQSYAEDSTVPTDAVKAIECRRTRCAVDLQLPLDTPPPSVVSQTLAIEQWIAWKQPCEYAIAHDLNARTVVVLLNCGQ